MAYTQAELSGPVQLGDDKKMFFYDAEDASDSIASVLASGYFNNSDDDIRMAVNDLIQVKTSAGQYMLQVTASTGGAVTTHLVSGNDAPVETGSTSAQLSGYGLSVLAGSATGNEKIYRLPAPTRIGQRKSLLASTATDHSVISTGGWTYYPSGNSSITLIGDATLGASVELVARSTTQWVVMGFTLASTGERLSST